MNSPSAPIRLTPRAEDDLMRLFGRIRQELQDAFQRYSIHPLPGQIEELETAVQAILTGTPGSVTVVPLVPGGGKSTLLRAFLTVAAQVLSDMSTPLSQKLGGVVVVVEKVMKATNWRSFAIAPPTAGWLPWWSPPTMPTCAGANATMAQPAALPSVSGGAALTGRSALSCRPPDGPWKHPS